jgi:hypothetical protein
MITTVIKERDEVYTVTNTGEGETRCQCDAIIKDANGCEFCGKPFCTSCGSHDWNGTGWDVCEACESAAYKYLMVIRDQEIKRLRAEIKKASHVFNTIVAFGNRAAVRMATPNRIHILHPASLIGRIIGKSEVWRDTLKNI